MPTIPYSFVANTVAESTKVNSNFSTLGTAIRPTFVFTVVGVLSTGTSVTPALIVPSALTIVKAYAYVKTVNTGADLILDINKNDTSIWSATPANRLTMTDGDADKYTTQTIFDTTTLAEGDILSLDIDSIGSTIAGADLTVQLKCS